jgi:PE family
MKRWGLDMSFVTAAPEQVQATAQGLAGIRSTLTQASATVVAPTTGVVAAAQDEVSAGVAAFFGAFGQEYQFISAQTQAFHEQFVNLLNAGAAAYLGTEVANAEQNLLGAANGPIQGLLGQSAGATAGMNRVVGAAASGSTAGPVAHLILGGGGGLGPILGGTPVGRGITGAVTALQNAGPATLLSGQPGAVLPTLPGKVAGVPAALTGLELSLAHAALRAAASTSLASVEGPYQTLFANTAANLQALGGAIAANPAPVLDQLVANEIGYAQTIATGVEFVIQNFPAVLASLPANIQAAVQALLAFNPAPYMQQFIDNQIAYAQIIAMSLQNAAHDFGTGLMALPAAFQSAFQALRTGDIAGAVTDVAQGFVNLVVTGVDVTSTGSITVAPGVTASVTPAGTLGDLLPILTIPGMRAQNFTNLLPPGSIPAQISQNFTNVIDTVTDTSLTAQALLAIRLIPPSATLSVTVNAGLQTALIIDAVGAPYNAAGALGSSITTFVDEWQTGDLTGAIDTVIDAPAVVTNSFLNGQSTLPLSFDISGFPATVNLPLNGILVPPTGYTASVNTGVPAIGTITVPVGGTPISGLATGLLVFAPEQLALAITP